MALMDEFKEEREAIKHAPINQKIKYFFDYYKWHVGIITLAIIFLITYFYKNLTETDPLLKGVLLNSHSESLDTATDVLIHDFIAKQNISSDKEDDIMFDTTLFYIGSDKNTILNSNYEAIQKLSTLAASGTLDFITGDMTAMIDLAYKNFFTNLTDVLTDDQITLYEPFFLYIDKTVMEEIDRANASMNNTTVIPYPNPSSPSDMKEPIPVLINLGECKNLRGVYDYDIGQLAFGIVCTNHIDITLQFLDYILK